ncbi:AbrB/MazE/SpoVT family DNA-binding domain-containing protein [Candidatus Protochlamydia phocaeensis]|uniref:AbrB/MazE/SpoVT family DNA-binding domain-containing protein n=1 Tax=Candidatus Protochlamydia phocaeensis TaxID=1414722 RepID=UPI0008399B6F|nr:AbrB/MazE/SpoVT family DNA-binding domain-containing protein [Candidatus Protochlamydia phocaeensis]
MIKRLIKHGNSQALVIDKALLQAAGLDEQASFQITVHPDGLTIQSVREDASPEEFRCVADKLLKSKSKLWKSLADK